MSLALTRRRAAKRVQDHGQLLQAGVPPSSSAFPLWPPAHQTGDHPCPVTWQGSVFLPAWEVVRGLISFGHPCVSMWRGH